MQIEKKSQVTPEKYSDRIFSFKKISYSRYIDQGFFIEIKHKPYLVCTTLDPCPTGLRYRISLFHLQDNLNSSIMACPSKLRANIYEKIHLAKINEQYFVSYRVEKYSCLLTVHKIMTNKILSIKNIQFKGFSVRINENAYQNLGKPFRCLFNLGSEGIVILDLKSNKKFETLSTISSSETIRYNPKNSLLAVKSSEDIYLLKILEDSRFGPILYKLRAEEPFSGVPSAPSMPMAIAKFKDLKDFAFDEENNLYIVFAWVMVDNRMVAPKITHIRFQKWNCDDEIMLEYVNDMECNQNRSQKFTFELKHNLCFLSGKNSLVIDLQEKIVQELEGKIELIEKHQSDVCYFKTVIPEM